MEELISDVENMLKSFYDYYPVVAETIQASGEPDEEVSECFSRYLKKSTIRKSELVDIADSSWKMCLIQHQLILKLRPRLVEALCVKQEKIIDLQDQLVKKKDEEIERLKSLADKVEDSVKLYSDAVVSATQQATFPSDLKQSVREAVQDAVKEEDQSRSMMIFGLSEENQQDLELRITEVFQELDEKPRIVEAERLGRPSEEKVRPVKVTLSASSAVRGLVGKGYRLAKSSRFRKVYLSPDRTKDERNRRKGLVEDLKQKKKSEPGLYHRIMDGSVVSSKRTET